MVKLLQNPRSLPLLRTDLGFPFDETFWNRFWNDYSLRSPLRSLTELTADWAPDMDISETDKTITVEANVAGYEPKDISVEIEDNILTLKGEMKKESEERKKTYFRQERCTGSFFRQVALPPVDDTKATCKAKNGTLTITLPKKEVKAVESKAHKLAIES